MGELKKWRDQKWVRIGTDGTIKGPCGTSKNKKTLTAVYHWLKLNVLVKKHWPLQPKRKKLQAEKNNL